MSKSRFTKDIHGDSGSDTFILLSSGYHKCRPLPLKEIDGSATIDNQISVISKMSKSAEIIIVLGYESHSVMQHIDEKHNNVRVVENTRFNETTSVESLRLGLNCSLPSNIYAIHGDIMFTSKALKSSDIPSIPVRKGPTKRTTNVGVLCNEDGSVKNMSYGLDDEWAEILHIPKKFFHLSRSLLRTSKSNHLFEFINDLTSHTKVMTHTINKKDSINIKD
jgi:hypothetical protein